jgi:hypothetical protein
MKTSGIINANLRSFIIKANLKVVNKGNTKVNNDDSLPAAKNQ